MRLAHEYGFFGQCRWCGLLRGYGNCIVVDPLAALPGPVPRELAIQQGQEAGRFGYCMSRNPYTDPVESLAWNEGFRTGRHLRRLQERDLNIMYGIS